MQNGYRPLEVDTDTASDCWRHPLLVDQEGAVDAEVDRKVDQRVEEGGQAASDVAEQLAEVTLIGLHLTADATHGKRAADNIGESLVDGETGAVERHRTRGAGLVLRLDLAGAAEAAARRGWTAGVTRDTGVLGLATEDRDGEERQVVATAHADVVAGRARLVQRENSDVLRLRILLVAAGHPVGDSVTPRSIEDVVDHLALALEPVDLPEVLGVGAAREPGRGREPEGVPVQLLDVEVSRDRRLDAASEIRNVVRRALGALILFPDDPTDVSLREVALDHQIDTSVALFRRRVQLNLSDVQRVAVSEEVTLSLGDIGSGRGNVVGSSFLETHFVPLVGSERLVVDRVVRTTVQVAVGRSNETNLALGARSVVHDDWKKFCPNRSVDRRGQGDPVDLELKASVARERPDLGPVDRRVVESALHHLDALLADLSGVAG